MLAVSRVTSDTADAFELAIRFYERSGYQSTGNVADSHGARLIEMARELQNLRSQIADLLDVDQ